MYDICPQEFVPYISLSGCKKSEQVYMKASIDFDDYTYVYEYMFKTYSIQLSFSSFEVQMLSMMIVAPNQLRERLRLDKLERFVYSL